MDSYTHIFNPKTNKKVMINSKQGRKTLRNFLNYINTRSIQRGGAAPFVAWVGPAAAAHLGELSRLVRPVCQCGRNMSGPGIDPADHWQCTRCGVQPPIGAVYWRCRANLLGLLGAAGCVGTNLCPTCVWDVTNAVHPYNQLVHPPPRPLPHGDGGVVAGGGGQPHQVAILADPIAPPHNAHPIPETAFGGFGLRPVPDYGAWDADDPDL
jgi:hypothetical protein